MRTDLRRAIAVLLITPAWLAAQVGYGSYTGGTLIMGTVTTFLAWCAAAGYAEAQPPATVRVPAGLAVASIALPAAIDAQSAFLLLFFAMYTIPFAVFWTVIWYGLAAASYQLLPRLPQWLITFVGVPVAFALGILLLSWIFPHELQAMFKI